MRRRCRLLLATISVVLVVSVLLPATAAVGSDFLIQVDTVGTYQGASLFPLGAVEPDQEVTFTVYAMNNSWPDATGLTMTFTLGPNLTLVGWTCVGPSLKGEGTNCTPSGTALQDTFTLEATKDMSGRITSNIHVAYTVKVRVASGASGKSSFLATVALPPGSSDHLISVPRTFNFLIGSALADAGKSSLTASPLLTPGDGKAAATVTVTLLQADGKTPASGKTVTLAQGSGTHAIIGPASGPSDAKGQVTFAVSDSTAEAVTFTATDSTDEVSVSQTATVTFLAHPAYLSGYPDGTFKPDDPVTRAQLAKILAVALGLDTAKAPAAGFRDVAADHWAYGYINAVKARGLVGGFPDGTFGPDGPVTHGQLATIAARQAGLQPVAGAGDHWAAGYIAAIRNAGYLKDFKDATFGPDDGATRAEVVVVVEQLAGRKPVTGNFQLKFSDVPANHWAAGYIQDATQEGWVQ